jgi:hypothetical protein
MRSSISWVLAVAAACKGGGGGEGSGAADQVRLPSAACTAAAETLTSFRLGNYATVEERAPVIDEIARECAAANLSDADATCLAKSADPSSAARCPRPITKDIIALVGDAKSASSDCRKFASMLGTLAKRQIEEMPESETKTNYRRLTPFMVQQYRKSCETWPAEPRKCFANLTEDAMEQGRMCMEQVPLDVLRDLERSLAPHVEAVMQGGSTPEVDAALAAGGDFALVGGGGASSVGIGACDAYVSARGRLDRCIVVPDGVRDATLAGFKTVDGLLGLPSRRPSPLETHVLGGASSDPRDLSSLPDHAKTQLAQICGIAAESVAGVTSVAGCP